MTRALATVGRLLRAVAAFAVLAAFIGGVPWLLTASAGWPLGWIGWPHVAQVPGLTDVIGAVTNPWSDQMILAMLASIGWVLWLIFVRDVAVEVIEASADAAAARHGRFRAPVGGRGPIRWVAAVLVGAIVGAVLFDAARAVTGTTGTSAAAAAADAAARRPAVTVAAPAVAAPVAQAGPRSAITVHAATAVPRLASADRHDSAAPTWARDAPGGIHHVKSGDNLWDIAENKLGDPHRWREIYTLNRGHEQANGYALTDPDEIHIGWVLALPAHDATPAQRPSTAPADSASSDTATPPRPSTAAPQPAAPTPEAATPSPPPATAAPTAPTSPAATSDASPSAPARATTDQPRPQASETTTPDHGSQDAHGGITLPSQGWVSLGLAALIAAVASLLRLQRRRHTRLGFPIPARLGPQPPPVPASLAPVYSAGVRRVSTDDEPPPPAAPALPAPIGLDAAGNEVSLFDLPGPGLALTGAGAESAARAVLAAALATGVNESIEARPVVVTTTNVLARLLPAGAPPVGLDPDQTSFDAERLIVLNQVAAAVTHAEEEMIVRRRLLDTFDLDSITALNARTDHAEVQPPYVVLVEATTRHAARLLAVGAHRAALHLHPVIVGSLDGIPTAETAADGTVTDADAAGLARLSTLAAEDLAAVLSMLTDAAPRPEPGHDVDLDPAPADAAASAEAVTEPVPAQATGTPAPVRLRVLGPLLLDTPAGPVVTGMRSGSYTVLASLVVHPSGRTLEQLAADLHPNDDPKAAGKRIRTDISTLRKVLRTATGNAEAMFVNYDAASGRYTIDADLIAVDLWQMLTAINAANTADDDTAALAALHEAAGLYTGDFADGKDQTWISDHATTYRHQVLAVYARIAEITEPDHPDEAVAALERALDFDPVNEELYQRIMRIHGRAGRPDVVRRTLHRLEECLADLGDAEPTEATRRVAERQLRPATTGSGGRR